MLQLKNISRTYASGANSQTALDNVNISFRQNEFVAILGPSGSGKTTLLNIVGGLDKYDSGDLVISGRSTKDFSDGDWDAYRNNSVGFVFQSYNLISHLSIVDNVELGMTLSGVSHAKKHKKAIEVLTKVGLKDHIGKKPNQLSGGQMQRVAIARALANDPDIILADEPTGALDTNTSMQILELIKEISSDKLVIMVTHNPGLAEKYADRIIELRDGRLISDSKPYNEQETALPYSLRRTSMNFFTALKLSGMNIKTKKLRTALTAFASSIGIIGIALILAMSNGFNKQIDDFEANTLSGFPIMITQAAAETDMGEIVRQSKKDTNDSNDPKEENDYPDTDVVYPYDPSKDKRLHTNKITDDYVSYIEKINPEWLTGISYTRLANMNMLKKENGKVKTVNTASLNFTAYPFQPDGKSEDYLKANYDLLAGEYPSDKTDLILIVDKRNRVDVSALESLGLNFKAKNIRFSDIIGYELKLILNDDYYKKAGDFFTVNGTPDNLMDLYNSKNALTLKIVGIMRPGRETKIPVLQPGISYSDKLAEFFIEDAKNSEIVKAQTDAGYNVMTGETFNTSAGSPISGSLMSQGGPPIGPPDIGSGSMMGASGGGQGAPTKESMLRALGADGIPFMITIYPKDFKFKDNILDYLDNWNKGLKADDMIVYNDLAGTISKLSRGIMDAITIVLVAFAGISLIVSLIMVGIITYISVLERTKEIGILRALGARKKDITRVFNAETFIIGAVSGLLGIAVAAVLTIPANNIMYNMTELKNVAQMNPFHAALLIAVSVSLTMLGGLIPALMAAKKDPVAALRSE